MGRGPGESAGRAGRPTGAAAGREVAPGRVPAILRPLMYRDLFGLEEGETRRVLLETVRGPARPGQEPAFPAGARRGS